MAKTIVKSTGPDAKRYHITLENTGPQTGTVRLQTWKSAADEGTKPPVEDKTYKLFNIRAKADGTKLVCKVDGPLWLDPDATITAQAEAGKPAVVRLVLSGFVNLTLEREVSAADLKAVTKFIIDFGLSPHWVRSV